MGVMHAVMRFGSLPYLAFSYGEPLRLTFVGMSNLFTFSEIAMNK